MDNPEHGYTVNLKQRTVADDHLARLHKNMNIQPPLCQLEKVSSFKWFPTLDDAVNDCKRHQIPFRPCVHCMRDGITGGTEDKKQ